MKLFEVNEDKIQFERNLKRQKGETFNMYMNVFGKHFLSKATCAFNLSFF